jgi:cold shock CspA family protein
MYRIAKPERSIASVDPFGFIVSDEVPSQKIYFKTSWFLGRRALRRGERVTFELKTFGGRVQAHNLARPGTDCVVGGWP